MYTTTATYRPEEMEGRNCDPIMSSFLSVDAYVQDPSNAQGLNRYSYCLNNPLRYTDPTGWLYLGASRSQESELNRYRRHANASMAEEQWANRGIDRVILATIRLGVSLEMTPFMMGEVRKGGGEPNYNGCWIIGKNGNVDYVFGVSTQAELEKYGPSYGVYGTVIGPSFRDEKYYYSILGYKVDLNEENGLAAEIAQKIDDALVKYAKYGWDLAMGGNAIQEFTNFSSEKAPFQTDWFGLSFNSIRTFNVGPAQCHYIIFDNAAAMQAKLDYIPTGDVANSSNGRGTQQDWINGVELRFVNSVSTSEQSNYTVSMVFPLQSYKKGFLLRYNCFFKNYIR